jgi:phage shock protein PspC (stress-responsive transcriptional regulator)
MPQLQLARSTTDKHVAGVCGGLAEYFTLDAVLVRVAFVIAALMGWGVFAYVLLWILMPERTEESAAPHRSRAVGIAEERYARGEITAEELDRIRRDLGAES